MSLTWILQETLSRLQNKVDTVWEVWHNRELLNICLRQNFKSGSKFLKYPDVNRIQFDKVSTSCVKFGKIPETEKSFEKIPC